MVYNIGAITKETESYVYIYDEDCRENFYNTCLISPSQRLCLISVYIDLPAFVICPKHRFVVLEEDQNPPDIDSSFEAEGITFSVISNIYSYNEIENEFEYY